ncbi:MAG: type II toxin-antitoxin system death-on-curing family toxin [Desulfobacteraceae bacterium]|nr:type II toxin-antitoxin system death-on-curing family toxin [Desulfobacteraceae bacterium]
MKIRFLTYPEVMEIYKATTSVFGGDYGVRDPNMLESALAQPEAGGPGGYYHRDIFEMAAAYLFHVSENQAFIDGNKRMGVMLALVFLELNGFELTVEPEVFTNTVLDMVDGKLGKAEIAAFFRDNCTEQYHDRK